MLLRLYVCVCVSLLIQTLVWGGRVSVFVHSTQPPRLHPGGKRSSKSRDVHTRNLLIWLSLPFGYLCRWVDLCDWSFDLFERQSKAFAHLLACLIVYLRPFFLPHLYKGLTCWLCLRLYLSYMYSLDAGFRVRLIGQPYALKDMRIWTWRNVNSQQSTVNSQQSTEHSLML